MLQEQGDVKQDQKGILQKQEVQLNVQNIDFNRLDNLYCI
jgi:hypothetical protein